MNFDIPTLMAAGAFVTGVAGLLVGLGWFADREARAFPWWAAGNAAMAAGIVLLIVDNGAVHSIGMIVGVFLMALGPALLWTAVRVFHRRKPHLLVAAAILALMVASGLVPAFAADPMLPAAVNLGVSAAFLAAAALELARPQALLLRARWPLVGFLTLHAAVFAIGAIEAVAHVFPAGGPVTFAIWFGVIHFEQLIFAVASSILLVAMVREESEQRHRLAAFFDSLTGVASRRAFFENAERQLRACLENDAPFSVAIFDLDRFKHVNDTYGHATGDQMLQLFSQIAQARLKENDLIGRLGGEEFAIAMPGSSPGAAYVVAERIRFAFAEGRAAAAGETIRTTASAGIATAHPRSTLSDILAAADAALYEAKARGRNRVELATRANRDGDSAVVVRVA